MSTLTLVRHGQASFGQANYDKLSELGKRQARVTGRHLRDLGFCFDVWLSGTMSRQNLTATLAAAAWDEAPAVQVRAAFNEYDANGLFGAYLPAVLEQDAQLQAQQAQIFSDGRLFQQAFVQMVRKWQAAAPHEGPAFESWAAFCQRVNEGLMTLHGEFGRDAELVLFTSGGPIAVSLAMALGLDDETIMQINWSINNAAMTRLRSTRSGWRLLGFNDITHLRLANDPALITHR